MSTGYIKRTLTSLSWRKINFNYDAGSEGPTNFTLEAPDFRVTTKCSVRDWDYVFVMYELHTDKFDDKDLSDDGVVRSDDNHSEDDSDVGCKHGAEEEHETNIGDLTGSTQRFCIAAVKNMLLISIQDMPDVMGLMWENMTYFEIWMGML